MPNDATCEIHVVVLLGESSQLVHVVVEHTIWLFLYARGILVELAHQYTIGSLGVLVGTVSLEVFLHLSATEELIGCGKVAALHLHEDGLRIDETEKFLGKHRYVEVIGVITGKVATRKILVEGRGQFLECRSILHVLIADARQLYHLLWDSLARVDVKVLANF